MKILFCASDLRSVQRFRMPFIKDLRQKGHLVKIMAPNADFPIPFENQKKNILNDLKILFKMLFVFLKWRPDIVFAYHLKPAFYIGFLLYLFPKIRYFPTVTGLGYLKDALYLHPFYKLSLKRANKVFVQNQDDILWLKKNILDKEKAYCHVFGSGIDLNEFPFCEMPQTPLSFLFAGRFLKPKGVLDYIQSFGKLKEKYPLFKATLLGMSDGHPESISEAEIKKQCIDHGVDFIGHVDDVRPFLISHHIFVLPSIYPEGVPRAGIEALAIGRPVITTKAPGCRDLLLNENGLFIETSLFDAMEKCLFLDLCLLGKKSRDLAEEVFDVEKVNQNYYDAIF